MLIDPYREAIRQAGHVGYGCKSCGARGSVIRYYHPQFLHLEEYCLECSAQTAAPLPLEVQIKTNQSRIAALENLLTQNENSAKIESAPKNAARKDTMPEDVTTTKQPALLGYFEVDPNNDWVMDPAQFLESNGYNTPGHYLNDILDNNEVEMTTGTLALCYGECVIPPGQEKCEHGAPAAKLYFEFQAMEEGDAA